MEYITVRDAAKKWRVSERWVQQYCRTGRVDGASRFGRSWMIPKDAEKPSDPRRMSITVSQGNNSEGDM
jgi:hypothetical protein